VNSTRVIGITTFLTDRWAFKALLKADKVADTWTD
jgi:hypothetical protein